MIMTPASGSGRSRRRILVVDDDPAVLDLIIARLEVAGYETCWARDGAAAMERLRDVRPAAMILDLSMPHLDGFGVLDLMSRRPDLAATPVLVLSARSGAEDVRLALTLGASDYLAKPFDTPRLLARVARLLRPRRTAPPASGDDTMLI